MRSELTGVLCHLRVFKHYGYVLTHLWKVSGTDTHLTPWSVLGSPRSFWLQEASGRDCAPPFVSGGSCPSGVGGATVGTAVRSRDGFCTDVLQHSTAKASGASPCVQQPEARHPRPLSLWEQSQSLNAGLCPDGPLLSMAVCHGEAVGGKHRPPSHSEGGAGGFSLPACLGGLAGQVPACSILPSSLLPLCNPSG